MRNTTSKAAGNNRKYEVVEKGGRQLHQSKKVGPATQ